MKTKTDRILARFMRAPLVDWPKMADRLTKTNDNAHALIEASRLADAQLQRLALFAEYADIRGCANTHALAFKHAQRRVAKVRKALGYSYPKAGLASMTW